jgi:hypothetical protein
MVPAGVAMIAALYSLWTGAAWFVAVIWAIAIVGLTLGVRWVGERRRDG